jgi:hypothetical protein
MEYPYIDLVKIHTEFLDWDWCDLTHDNHAQTWTDFYTEVGEECTPSLPHTQHGV